MNEVLFKIVIISVCVVVLAIIAYGVSCIFRYMLRSASKAAKGITRKNKPRR